MISECLTCGLQKPKAPFEQNDVSHGICSDECTEVYLAWSDVVNGGTPTLRDFAASNGVTSDQAMQVLRQP